MEPGTTLGIVPLQATVAKGIPYNVLHADSTSFPVHGVYETEFGRPPSLLPAATASTTAGSSGSSRPALVLTEPAPPSSMRFSKGTPIPRVVRPLTVIGLFHPIRPKRVWV